MTERLPDGSALVTRTLHEPADPEWELRRKNMLWGLALFGFVIMLFGASILVAVIYLALD
jgi:hypothetical protein